MHTQKLNNDLISIEPLTIEHGETLYHLIDESRLQLKNLIWSQNATLNSTKKFIADKNQSQDKIFGVFYKEILIGVLELRKKENFSELGYWLGTKYRGHGLMKIAVKNLVDEEIMNGSIIAHIRETNKASYKILHYAGLHYDHSELWQNEEWLHLKRSK